MVLELELEDDGVASAAFRMTSADFVARAAAWFRRICGHHGCRVRGMLVELHL